MRKDSFPTSLDARFVTHDQRPVPAPSAPAPVLRYMDIALIAALAFVVVALIS
jgi:hypothetical protein